MSRTERANAAPEQLRWKRRVRSGVTQVLVYAAGLALNVTILHRTTGQALRLFGAEALGVLIGLVLVILLPNTRPGRIVLEFSAQRLTGLAVLLAGRRRAALRDEWRAHLAGDGGHDPVSWPKIRQALGFVAAAGRFRLADAADQAWRPADAVLGSRTLSNLFVLSPTAAAAMVIFHHDGIDGLLRSAGGVVAIGGALYALVRVGRWWRDVKPPEPKARRARE
jgi:hypothetical protein